MCRSGLVLLTMLHSVLEHKQPIYTPYPTTANDENRSHCVCVCVLLIVEASPDSCSASGRQWLG